QRAQDNHRNEGEHEQVHALGGVHDGRLQQLEWQRGDRHRDDRRCHQAGEEHEVPPVEREDAVEQLGDGERPELVLHAGGMLAQGEKRKPSSAPFSVFGGRARPYANSKVSPSPSTPIVTVPPFSRRPKRISSVSRSRTSRWMTRASGRAPY